MTTTPLLRTLLLVLCLGMVPMATQAQEGDYGNADYSASVTADVAPPPIPVYDQPPPPAEGYLWTPGYWAFGPNGYYWVPGTWVLPPTVGFLWTPGYWAFELGSFIWNVGYWGPHIGFYGGINYGFGYFGIGFEGGYWNEGRFCYNRAVTNVTNVNITNIYNHVPNHFGDNNRTGFNGGRDGTQVRPSGAELAIARTPHRGPTADQGRHEWAARTVPALLASANHGKPAIAATPRPAAFHAPVATAARGGSVTGSPATRADRPAWATQPSAGHSALNGGHDTRQVTGGARSSDNYRATPPRSTTPYAGTPSARDGYRASTPRSPAPYASHSYPAPRDSYRPSSPNRPAPYARSNPAPGYHASAPRNPTSYGAYRAPQDGYRASTPRSSGSYGQGSYRAPTYSHPAAQSRGSAPSYQSFAHSAPVSRPTSPSRASQPASGYTAQSHAANDRHH